MRVHGRVAVYQYGLDHVRVSRILGQCEDPQGSRAGIWGSRERLSLRNFVSFEDRFNAFLLEKELPVTDFLQSLELLEVNDGYDRRAEIGSTPLPRFV